MGTPQFLSCDLGEDGLLACARVTPAEAEVDPPVSVEADRAVAAIGARINVGAAGVDRGGHADPAPGSALGLLGGPADADADGLQAFRKPARAEPRAHQGDVARSIGVTQTVFDGIAAADLGQFIHQALESKAGLCGAKAEPSAWLLSGIDQHSRKRPASSASYCIP